METAWIWGGGRRCSYWRVHDQFYGHHRRRGCLLQSVCAQDPCLRNMVQHKGERVRINKVTRFNLPKSAPPSPPPSPPALLPPSSCPRPPRLPLPPSVSPHPLPLRTTWYQLTTVPTDDTSPRNTCINTVFSNQNGSVSAQSLEFTIITHRKTVLILL